MKILITGAGGQLGQTIMNSTHDMDHELFFTARKPDMTSVKRCLPLDITDKEKVCKFLSDTSVDVIRNCAGYTDVAKAETDSAEAFRINAAAVANLADAARQYDALLVHISTDYVFDGKSSVPYKEDDKAEPVNEYGRSKLAGEQAVLQSGCRYMIFRTSWLYSIYGRNFFKTIMNKADENSSINVVSDQVGTPTYAGDLMEALFHIIDEGMTDKVGVYNFTNEGVCSWYDFAKQICAETGSLCEVMPCSTREYPSNVIRPSYSVLDKARFKKTFGSDIPHWKDSLSFCVSELEKFG